MSLFLHRLASPKHFYCLSGRWLPWLGGITLILLATGLYLGLWVAPPDYQQGEAYRIIYVHVPAAWMSLFVYVFMAVAGAIGLIWNIKMADVMAVTSAPLGAAFTFLALITGAIWGKPMWGAFWVWDARLTSELILLFLYLGYIALTNAIEDPRTAARAGAILAIVGSVNIPIIHYSVEWWNTLHQGPTITRFAKPAIHASMLWPLLLMALGFQSYFFTVLLIRARTELLKRERRSRWVQTLFGNSGERIVSNGKVSL
ncbi:MAG: heme ABC transporter permease [Methylohalobius sp.]|nr:heme ABC transporter permease [Methylohalobius sp.]